MGFVQYVTSPFMGRRMKLHSTGMCGVFLSIEILVAALIAQEVNYEIIRVHSYAVA